MSDITWDNLVSLQEQYMNNLVDGIVNEIKTVDFDDVLVNYAKTSAKSTEYHEIYNHGISSSEYIHDYIIDNVCHKVGVWFKSRYDDTGIVFLVKRRYTSTKYPSGSIVVYAKW